MTEAEIEAKRTARGGFTRATLAGWGVPWPPPKGWKRQLLSNNTEPTMNQLLDDAFAMLAQTMEYAMSLEKRIEDLEDKVSV